MLSFQRAVLSETDQNQATQCSKAPQILVPSTRMEDFLSVVPERGKSNQPWCMRSFPSGPRGAGWLRDSATWKRRLHLERHCASPPAPPTHQEGQIPVTGTQQGDVPLLTSDASCALPQNRNCRGPGSTQTVPATLLLGPLLDRIRELQPAGADVPLAATTPSNCSSNPTPAS